MAINGGRRDRVRSEKNDYPLFGPGTDNTVNLTTVAVGLKQRKSHMIATAQFCEFAFVGWAVSWREQTSLEALSGGGLTFFWTSLGLHSSRFGCAHDCTGDNGERDADKGTIAKCRNKATVQFETDQLI